MSMLDIINLDYGQPIELTFKDVDTGNPVDVSGYSSQISMIFVPPSGTPITKGATFKTDGRDGVITYTPEALFLVLGDWRVRGQVTAAAARLSTVWHYFRVLE